MTTSNHQWKYVTDGDANWQLYGESELHAAIIPQRPTSAAPITVRVTHSNAYGPFDEADIFVRCGDPDRPTEQDDVTSHDDWVPAKLIEEVVNVDGEDMLRSDAEEPFEDETYWYGTYEAPLRLPAGRRSIEIKLVSRQPELMPSLVVSGLDLDVP